MQRKTASELKLSGAYRADRHGDRLELPNEMAPAPDWLNDDERAVFDAYAEKLHERGMMSPLYTTGLGMMAKQHVEYLNLSKAAETTPLFTETTGGVAQHPVHRMKARAWADLLKISREFGMTPSAIAGVKTGGSNVPGIPNRAHKLNAGYFGLEQYKLNSNPP